MGPGGIVADADAETLLSRHRYRSNTNFGGHDSTAAGLSSDWANGQRVVVLRGGSSRAGVSESGRRAGQPLLAAAPASGARVSVRAVNRLVEFEHTHEFPAAVMKGFAFVWWHLYTQLTVVFMEACPSFRRNYTQRTGRMAPDAFLMHFMHLLNQLAGVCAATVWLTRDAVRAVVRDWVGQRRGENVPRCSPPRCGRDGHEGGSGHRARATNPVARSEEEAEESLMDLSASAAYALVMLVALRRSRAREESVHWEGGGGRPGRRRMSGSSLGGGGRRRHDGTGRRMGYEKEDASLSDTRRGHIHDDRYDSNRSHAAAHAQRRHARVTTLVGSLVDDFSFEIEVQCTVWVSALNYVYKLIASFCLDEDGDSPSSSAPSPLQSHAQGADGDGHASSRRRRVAPPRHRLTTSRPLLTPITASHVRQIRRLSQHSLSNMPLCDVAHGRANAHENTNSMCADDGSSSSTEDDTEEEEEEEEDRKVHSTMNALLAGSRSPSSSPHATTTAEEAKAGKFSAAAAAQRRASRSVVPSPPDRMELAAARRAKRRALVQGGGGVGYTMSEVRQMNTPERTWTVINSFVYDITRFVRVHPGGMGNILEYAAGQDATAKFFEAHSNNAAAVQQLESMRIGVLIDEEEK